MDDESDYALAAQFIESLTPAVQRQIVQRWGSYSDLFCGPPPAADDQITAGVRKQFAKNYRTIEQSVARCLDQCRQVNARHLALTSADYPPLLREIASPPPLLYVRGSIECLHLPQLAVVGSRRMSAGGQTAARDWSAMLARSGFVITSGLALGVDGEAHSAALSVSGGKTVAVMATGVDVIYPRRHEALAEQIVAGGGALVTEFPPGTKPLPGHFPRRNRIISGLSLGVLVVEAAVQSGSLITARCALEQNREVFAIPGSVHNPLAKGCHELIKQGAQLVECAQDIVSQLGGGLAFLGDQSAAGADQAVNALAAGERDLLEVLGFDPLDTDTLCQRAKLDIGELNQLLVGLELKNMVENNGGQWLRIK